MSDAVVTREAPVGIDDIRRLADERGGRLPPEIELAEHFGIGRNSMRELLIRLESLGYISRRHGAGTFVNPAAADVKVRIDRRAEFVELLAAAGYEAQVQLVEAGFVDWPEEATARMPELGGMHLYRTRKRWLADGIPFMMAVDYIPAAQRMDVDATRSVFDLARELNGYATEWINTIINPVLAGDAACSLACRKQQPVLRLDQVGVSRDGTRCWLAQDYHNPHAAGLDLSYGIIRTYS